MFLVQSRASHFLLDLHVAVPQCKFAAVHEILWIHVAQLPFRTFQLFVPLLVYLAVKSCILGINGETVAFGAS